ncbi:bifunctional DNA primase/polymerase [Streptomyces nigrescens]|uniref:bifunctional DNA primase/polymerase n=1 Tax=Streptomyces nigrescens TaxID=1920 RepID=UPI0036FD99B7
MTTAALQQPPSLKAAALDAARRGWRIFPLQPHGTEPAVRNWAERATRNPLRIARTWDHGPYNIGMLPCTSGLVVLECAPRAEGEDVPQAWRVPGVHDGLDALAVLAEQHSARFPTELYTVATPGGGRHMYFAHPAGPCPPASDGPDSALGWHIATRTTPGYVLAAGSVTADGVYSLVHDAPPGVWPAWLADCPAGAASACERTR